MSMLPDEQQDRDLTQMSIASVLQQLDAANQRLLDYESQIAAVCPEDLSLAEAFGAVTKRAEAAERKLATALEALQNIKRHQEVVAGDSLPKRGATWLIADRALAQIEQPQQAVMGTVPNTKGRDWVRERFVVGEIEPHA